MKKLSLNEAKPANIEKEVQSQMEAANERSVIDVLVSEKSLNGIETHLNENTVIIINPHKPEIVFFKDVSNLAPRKPDWDLKRDAAKKLERLERRTQKAIAELIRERLKNEENMDLATSVALGAELQAAGDDE